MLIQKLTLICASVSIAVLTACGGANMSGAISPRKEKTDKSGAKDASVPAVVTGAYLTCDYSSKDDSADSQGVGCSAIDQSGNVIQPTATNKLAFYRTFKNGAYLKPDRTKNSSEPQAIFIIPRSQIGESKYKATYANKWGLDEFSCDSLPCRRPMTPNATPSYLALEPSASSPGVTSAAVWSMDQKYTEAVKFFRNLRIDLNYIDPSLYCQSSGGSDIIRLGRNPGQDYTSKVLLPPGITIPTIGSSQIRSINRMYVPTSYFAKHTLKGGGDKEIGSGCIVLSLKKRLQSRGSVVPDFYVDEMSKTGPRIEDEQFHIILPKTPENEIIAQGFLDSIP
jgi:hypothetical protein